MACDALNDLGDLVVGKVVDGVNLDAWALLALLVGHLSDVGINLVNGQTRAAFQIAAVLNLNGPLVASGKLNVIQRLGSVCGVRIIDQAPELDRLVNLGVCAI